jgi:RNA polymerase sigma-70 factor (ECF subfamily)
VNTPIGNADLHGFEALRPYLFAIAYRMLGRASDAEDVVQDAWVRYQTAAPAALDSLKAYLTTIVTRLCLDRLKAAHTTREQYVGPWLPEPILTDGPTNPEQLMARYESITMGFLVLLETLTPPERAVFLLREVFDYDYDAIAGMLDTTAANCRQLLSRAKSRIAEGRPRGADPRVGPNDDARRRLVEAFVHSMERGDAGELAAMLADDVQFWADGGGKVAAAGRPLFGRDAVLKLLLGLRRTAATTLGLSMSSNVSLVNGEPAIVVRAGPQIDSVYVCSIVDGRIAAIHAVRNPDKLGYLKSQLQG